MEWLGTELCLRHGAIMGQSIGPRELALRAQREARYQQTHKSPRMTAGALKSKIEAIPAKKPPKAHRKPAKGQRPTE
jgi:hypothetical protein